MAATVQTRAAIWVSPKRIAISVVAAGAISALLLVAAGGATLGAGNGLLKKDDAPVAPMKAESGGERRPIMRKEMPLDGFDVEASKERQFYSIFTRRATYLDI